MLVPETSVRLSCLKLGRLAQVASFFVLSLLLSPQAWSLPAENSNPQHNFAVPSGLQTNEYSILAADSPLQRAVQWDSRSLIIGGQRQFLFCGEFHSWRLPVKELWLDVLEKIAAAGFNCVSVYTHWGLAQPSAQATPSLTGHNDLLSIIKYAQAVGLFLVVRPGPYVNAETTAGGLPPFLTNINATLRTNDTLWEAAWKPYIKTVVETVKPWQLSATPDGSLVGGGVLLVQAENEYHAGPRRLAYMKELVLSLKKWGITVPITYNDSGEKRPADLEFVGAVDIWGFDSYPQRFDCSQPDTWHQMPSNYSAMHKKINPDQPFYIPEFQAGAYDPFEGPGYAACGDLTSQNFARVANHLLFSQRISMLSLYMLAGGTNWGGLAEPDVYTSYDYGAAISESRQLTSKYYEYKQQGLFLRSFPGLVSAKQVSIGPSEDDEDLLVTQLLNEAEGSRYYFIRHRNMTSTANKTYEIAIQTSEGRFVLSKETASSLRLRGRDSQVVVTDRCFSNGACMIFASGRVVLADAVGKTDVLVLQCETRLETVAWSLPYNEGITVDAFFATNTNSTVVGKDAVEALHLKTETAKNGRVLLVSYRVPSHASSTNPSIVRINIGARRVLLVLASEQAANVLYAPAISSTPLLHPSPSPPTTSSNSLAAYWGISTNATAIVAGSPFLRRAMSSPDGRTLHLWGNTEGDIQIDVLAAENFELLSWNGVSLKPWRSAWGGLVANVRGVDTQVASYVPPDLSTLLWKRRDSLPEIGADFDDASWISANKTSSFNPYFAFPVIQTEGQVLFAGEYGYHANHIIWRGRFVSDSKCETAFSITVQGGKSFAFSVWLNDHFLGSAVGDRKHAAAATTLPFPSDSLRKGINNVTVLQDHMGYEMEYGALDIGPVRNMSSDEGKEGFSKLDDGDIDDNTSDASPIEATKLPRGILAYRLHSDSLCSSKEFRPSLPRVTWKVAGNLGGESAPDKIRTYLNEGGLFAERQGWHLPGYDDSGWEVGKPWSDGGQYSATHLKGGSVTFYRTLFNLSLPKDHDVALSIEFPADGPSGKGRSQGTYRAQLYVNGWQMGKRLAALGPQTSFPIPRGVLLYSGDDPAGVGSNTLGLSIWAVAGGERNRKLEAPLSIRVLARSKGTVAERFDIKMPKWSELRRGR